MAILYMMAHVTETKSIWLFKSQDLLAKSIIQDFLTCLILTFSKQFLAFGGLLLQIKAFGRNSTSIVRLQITQRQKKSENNNGAKKNMG